MTGTRDPMTAPAVTLTIYHADTFGEAPTRGMGPLPMQAECRAIMLDRRQVMGRHGRTVQYTTVGTLL
jgi:hypothetical protein